MRLNEFEIKSIIESVFLILGHQKVKIYLYGSRIDDSLKGGDIDIIVVALSDSDYNLLSLKKYQILSNLKRLIGDQKIDLSVITKVILTTDVFFSQLKIVSLYSP
ncbi:MAG: hypothetical protein HQK49_16850 [Oligoflexia bacterium]|nr:hypothetical protein [Oligoflexia bacterium]